MGLEENRTCVTAPHPRGETVANPGLEQSRPGLERPRPLVGDGVSFVYLIYPITFLRLVYPHSLTFSYVSLLNLA